MAERESLKIPGTTFQRVEWGELAARQELHRDDFIQIIDNPAYINALRMQLKENELQRIDSAYKLRLKEVWRLTPNHGEWDDFLTQRMKGNDGVMIWNKLTGEWRRTLSKEEYRRVFESRLGHLFTRNEIENMKNKIGVFFGMSTGSEVLKTLLQEGMENFIAADPDEIDLSNITRLSDATDADVGKNKAVLMGNVVVGINPYAKFTLFPRKLDDEEMKSVIAQGEYVIEMIDGIDKKIVIRDLAKAVANETGRNIPVIMGTNLFDAPLITVDMMEPTEESKPKVYFQNPELTEEDLQILKSKPRENATPAEKMADFIHKTAKAIKLIGRANIPDRHMVSFILSAKGKVPFWSQRGSDAKMVGILVEHQVRKFINGLQVDPISKLPSQVQYPDDDVEFLRDMTKRYPEVFSKYSSLAEAINAEYNEIFAAFA